MIFTGPWYDPQGREPFPGVKLVHFHSPGGSCSHNLTGIRNGRSTRLFVAATRTLAYLWDYHLSPAERAAWVALDEGPRDRWNEIWNPQHNGFLSFQARNMQHMYYDRLLEANPPSEVPGIGIAEFLVLADIATQVLTYSYSYNAAFATQTQATVTIYQVNPHNCAGPVHRRQTRLIAKDTTWTPGGGVQQADVDAAFTFADYPDVFTLWRVGDGGIYHLNHAISSTPT